MIRRLRKLRRTRSRAALTFLAVVPVFVLLAYFPGCQAGYLRRQAWGALGVLCGRVTIDERLLSRLSAEDRDKLLWVGRVRQFAANELGLDAGDAYTTYYDTGGAPISYIVVAAHPLALEPYRWHFPIAGRVPYKGYFRQEEARAERDRLLKAGWDAIATPVRAFSSLGWFSDPVLSSMLSLSPGEMADLLIHELTHRTVYFKDRTALNESLATLVAREGTLRLLRQAFGEDSSMEQSYHEYLAANVLQDGLLERLRADLDALYRSRFADAEKLKRKTELFSCAGRALEAAGLGRKLPASNAIVLLDREYSGLIPLLEAAQAAAGGHPRDLVAFLKKIAGARDPLKEIQNRAGILPGAPAEPGTGQD